jgi:uncharacterized membrane protein YesL
MSRISHETWARIIGYIYVILAVNLLMVLAMLPLLTMLVATDPRQTWPLIVLVAPLCAPALVGAFTTFASFPGEQTIGWAFATFVRGWWDGLGRSLTIGALTTAATVILIIDIAAVWGRSIGAAAIPVFVVLTLLTLVTALHALVALAERPRARIRSVLVVGAYAGLRRWYLTGLSFLAVTALWLLFTQAPAMALGFAATPLWYIAWANSRFALAPALLERAEQDHVAVSQPAPALSAP